MDLGSYVKPLIKWWWLLLVASVVAALSSFFVTRQQPPIYQTSTALVIGRSVYDPNPTSNDLWLGQQLANYYADIAYRDQVRNNTMEDLGLSWLPEYTVRPLPNSQIIEIVVRDTSPIRAQAVANELAKQLIMQSPSNPELQDQDRQEFINSQLTNLEEKITETEDELTEIQQQLADMTSARQIADAQREIDALEIKLTTLRTNYSNLLVNTGREADNSLTVLETASLPTYPVGPNKLMIMVLSTGIGFMLASAAAYLLEYLDDTFRSVEDLAGATQNLVIGTIPDTKLWVGNNAYIADQPGSAEAETFRLLRTNIEFIAVEQKLNTILISSANSSDGKTTVAINLAISMAQSGKRVILVDADMRKPNVHEIFGITDTRGLSDLFVNKVNLEIIITTWEKGEIVGILPAGKSPPNPAELLASSRMDEIISALKERADIVIIDSPPLFISDSIILSKKVDGVIPVVRYGFTRKKSVKASLEQLNRAQANIVGIVLNKMPKKLDDYQAGYRYYNKYYISENGKGTRKRKVSKSRKLLEKFSEE